MVGDSRLLSFVLLVLLEVSKFKVRVTTPLPCVGLNKWGIDSYTHRWLYVKTKGHNISPEVETADSCLGLSVQCSTTCR